jgi:outer membrane lipoprotein-sorting protein
MKSLISKALTGLLVIFTLFTYGQDAKVDKILARHFKATGQEKLVKTGSIKMQGNSQMQGNIFPFTMYIKRPNMIRNEVIVQGQEMIQAYDGENGWIIAPWMGTGVQNLTGFQLKSMKENSNMDGELYQWEEKGHELNYLGEEDLDGKPAYNLQLVKENGDTIHFFIDSEQYLILKQTLKTTINNQNLALDTYLNNYKMIDGIAFPTSIENHMPGNVNKITIDSIQVNLTLKNDLFHKP